MQKPGSGAREAVTRTVGSKRKQNETRIMAAAERVFAERGFDAATTAAIARRAGLPKANLHYYFRTKEALYCRVLDEILTLWLATADPIRPEADPKRALARYVADKIAYSKRRPHASKVFANEILHGAPHLSTRLAGDLRRWLDSKCAVLQGWIAAGRMAPLDPRHLFFVIWAATQTYADFDAQIAALQGRKCLNAGDFRAAGDLVTRMVLKICGLA